jgi:hypothetical protein
MKRFNVQSFKNRKTLFKRFLVCLCWNTIQYIFTVMPFDVIRYTFGPLSHSICLVHVLLKNTTNLHVCFFVNAIAVVRYISLFVTDEISEVQEAFWSCFVTTWVVIFSMLTQMVYLNIPGRQPLNYYICIGEDMPIDYRSMKVKMNYISVLVNVITVLIQFCIAFKVLKFKFDMEKNVENLSTIGLIQRLMSEFNLIFAVTLISSSFGFFLTKVHLLDPETVNISPNFYYLFVLNYFLPLGTLTGMSMLIYFRQVDLRNTVNESALNWCRKLRLKLT